METLLSKINNRHARVCLVGLGYVGLPLLELIHKAGYTVYGYDTDATKITLLQTNDFRASYVNPDFDYSEVFLTADIDEIDAQSPDIWVIAVPTPVHEEDKSPDYRPLDNFFQAFFGDTSFAPSQDKVLLCIESTVGPGYCDSLGDRYEMHIGLSNYSLGENLLVAFSPERVDPGNKKYTIQNTPKVVSANQGEPLEHACAFYSSFIPKIHPLNCMLEGELSKLYENCFRAVNIAFANEFADLCTSLGVSYRNVLEAASTKPFGFMPFQAGIGVGGHCIPADPHYLLAVAKENSPMPILQKAVEVNHSRPEKVIEYVKYFMGLKDTRKLPIVLLGLTYKADIDDLRASPALDIFDELDGPYDTYAYDPYIPLFGTSKLLPNLHRSHLSNSALVVILVAHEEFIKRKDYIANHSRHILDCAGVYSGNIPNVTKLID